MARQHATAPRHVLANAQNRAFFVSTRLDNGPMRFRLYPTASQTETLARHCSDARYIWNLALEQWNHWQPGFKHPPGYVEQARQLTELRQAEAWVAEGSVTVQQQALRDFARAWSNFFAGTHGRPTWRCKGTHEG